MTPSGIEPATFRFVAQNINHCATAVPIIMMYIYYIIIKEDVRLNVELPSPTKST
jgi:hypothetical protein